MTKKQTKDFNKPLSPFEAAERITRLRQERDAAIADAVEKARAKATEYHDTKEAKLRERCTDIAQMESLLSVSLQGDASTASSEPEPKIPEWAKEQPPPIQKQEVNRD